MTAGISLKKIALLTLFLAVFSFAQKKYYVSEIRQSSGGFISGGKYLFTNGRYVYRYYDSYPSAPHKAAISMIHFCYTGYKISGSYSVSGKCGVGAFSYAGQYDRDDGHNLQRIGMIPDTANCSYNLTTTATCEINSIPKCYTDAIEVNSANCGNGRGLYMIGTKMEIENYMFSKVGALWGKEDYANYSLLLPQPQTDTVVHENGECTLYGGGGGLVYEALICPTGFKIPKTSSSSIAVSSSSVAQYSSFQYDDNYSSQRPKVDYPPPPNWNYPDPPQWDWTQWEPPNYNMEIDFPKFELEYPDLPPIEIDIPPIDLTSLEKALTDLQGLINAGMGLSNQQLQLLNQLLNVTHSQGLLTEQLLTELANGLGLSNSTLEGVNSGIDSLSKLGNSQLQQNEEHFENYINALSKIITQLDEIGDAIKNQDGNSGDTTTAEIPSDPEPELFDTLGIIGQNQGVDFTIDSYLKDSVFILNEKFNIPKGGNAYDLSFNTGVAGIKYSGSFSLTNVYGVNVADYINGFLLFAVSIMNLFSYMRAIQTGGRG